MKNWGKAVFRCMILVVLLFMGAPAITLSASTGIADGRMKVVFVMDASGSMDDTDGGRLRFDALQLFLGLSADTGNYMGAVVFDDDIVGDVIEIKSVDGKASKTQLLNKIKNKTSSGSTNIGKAILTAVNMIEKSDEEFQKEGKEELPAAIILLSDGNTHFKKGINQQMKLEEAERMKQDAIDKAAEMDIPVYSVCLNQKGTEKPANVDELKEISESTGGKSREVKQAEDLKEVFNLFYNIIYSTKTVTLADQWIPYSGELEIPFQIPMIGVEEANIIINTLNENTRYSLSRPHHKYLDSELDSMSRKAKTFTVIKIKDPEPGDWKLVVKGQFGDQIRVDMVYNTDLSLKLEQKKADTRTWRLTASIYDKEKAVTKKQVYQNSRFWVTVTDMDTKETEELDMETEGEKSILDWEPSDYGEYKVQAFCEIDDIIVKSEAITVSFPNLIPKWKQNPILVKQNIHPFVEKIYTIDLRKLVSLEEGDIKEFCFKNPKEQAVQEGNVYLDDSLLCIKVRECGSTSFTITAIDEDGDKAEVVVKTDITDITVVIIVLVVALALVLIVLLMIPSFIKRNRVIRGTVQILPYEEGIYGQPAIIRGEKGKVRLSRYVSVEEPLTDIGIDLQNCYLVAGKKASEVYLESSKGYYVNTEPERRQKRICIINMIDAEISNDTSFETGIRITYKAMQ